MEKIYRLEESKTHKLRVEKVLGKKKYSAEKTFKIETYPGSSDGGTFKFGTEIESLC